MIDFNIGKRYRLQFENTPEGEVECEGCPLSYEGTCTEADSGWLCFEQEISEGGECVSFLNYGAAGWLDENQWTKLLSATEVVAEPAVIDEPHPPTEAEAIDLGRPPDSASEVAL
jgi:hypothetical protein